VNETLHVVAILMSQTTLSDSLSVSYNLLRE